MCWRRSGLFVISGEPCAGKCTLATKLAIHYAARCMRVLCIGSTPVAESDFSIHVCTIRTAFILPTLVCFRTISLSPSVPRFMRIVAADVIIIHAHPMISCHMLDQIFSRLIQTCELGGCYFIEKLIILVGDPESPSLNPSSPTSHVTMAYLWRHMMKKHVAFV
jgi:hypothetical protein